MPQYSLCFAYESFDTKKTAYVSLMRAARRRAEVLTETFNDDMVIDGDSSAKCKDSSTCNQRKDRYDFEDAHY
jgi:hypothetical protein